MRKEFKSLMFVTLIAFAQAFAQVPHKISYQAVIRDAQGALYKDKDLSIIVSIVNKIGNSEEVMYTKPYSTHTNSNGLVSLEIGSDDSAFRTIDWAKEGDFYVNTETTINGQTIPDSKKLLSVPFALYAHESAKVSGFTVGKDVPEDAVFTDNQTASDVAIEPIQNLDAATNVQMALEKLNEAITAAGNMQKSVYDTDGDDIVDNAAKVNGFEVHKSVPADAVFTDNQKATEIDLSNPIIIRGTEVSTVEQAIIRLQEEFTNLKHSTGN